MHKKYSARRLLHALVIVSCLLLQSGCLALIIGGAAGALGAYAVSKDTIQAETDIPFDRLVESARTICAARGLVLQEDTLGGYIHATIESSKVYVRLNRLTKSTVRVSVSARKNLLPNIELAQDVFVKIMENARRR